MVCDRGAGGGAGVEDEGRAAEEGGEESGGIVDVPLRIARLVPPRRMAA
jgi:hypothetical protein